MDYQSGSIELLRGTTTSMVTLDQCWTLSSIHHNSPPLVPALSRCSPPTPTGLAVVAVGPAPVAVGPIPETRPTAVPGGGPPLGQPTPAHATNATKRSQQDAGKWSPLELSLLISLKQAEFERSFNKTPRD